MAGTDSVQLVPTIHLCRLLPAIVAIALSLAPPAHAAASDHDKSVCKRYVATRWGEGNRGRHQYWQCLKFARHHPGVFKDSSGEDIHGVFRYGELLCDKGYFKRGYRRSGLCAPWPRVAGGHFTGSAPVLLHCDHGYVYSVDREPKPGALLLPTEQHCNRRPAGAAGNWCPAGYTPVTTPRDRMLPSGVDCIRRQGTSE